MTRRSYQRNGRAHGYLRKGGMLLGLLFGLLICAPQTAKASEATVETSQDLYDAISDEKTEISLGGDITLEKDNNCGALIYYNVTIDLCGHKLTAGNGSWNDRNVAMFTVGNNGSLTLKDSGTGGTVSVGDNNSGCAVKITDSGSFTMESGIIEGGGSRRCCENEQRNVHHE